MLLGDLLVWFYENLAGIKNAPGHEGYTELAMRPEPVDGLDYVNASYRSISGLIKSSWKKEGGGFNWDISIPANTKALIYVPAASEAGVTESGKAIVNNPDVHFVKMEAGRAVYQISSGNYLFKSHM
jgi:alpha-L-rhamnosidase